MDGGPLCEDYYNNKNNKIGEVGGILFIKL